MKHKAKDPLIPHNLSLSLDPQQGQNKQKFLLIDPCLPIRPTVLAVDLEGTLISNTMSQIPRPGLFMFLSRCPRCFHVW
jgi:hypothetical protein